MSDKQPWVPAIATTAIREMARGSKFRITLTEHAKDQMADRDLLVGDVMYVLKNGFVYEEPEPSTKVGLFKYKVENRTPNSGNRPVRIIAIPDKAGAWIKVVTVMWVDKP